MEKFEISNLNQVKKLAQKFAKLLKGGEIILLEGDLGAGKTTFTKFVLQALGVKGDITSPTFTIMREYKTSKFDIYHFDMYRLSSGKEAQEFGLDEYIYGNNQKNLVFIEWAENIKDILVGNFVTIKISMLDNGNRQFEICR